MEAGSEAGRLPPRSEQGFSDSATDRGSDRIAEIGDRLRRYPSAEQNPFECHALRFVYMGIGG